MHNKNEKSIREFLNSRTVTTFQYILIAVALMALTLDGLDIQLVALLSPAILTDWGVSKSSFGPAMAAALVGMIFGSSIGGWLGDRYGRKLTLIAATICFGSATILVSFTADVSSMTILRLISGLGFGAASPNCVALVTEWLPDKLRPRMTALLSIGVPLGGLIGSITLPSLLPVLDWPGCFVLFGGITLALAVAMSFLLGESPSYWVSAGKIERATAALQKVSNDTPTLQLSVNSSALHDQRNSHAPTIFTRNYLRVNIGAALLFFSVSFVAFGVLSWTPALLTTVGFSFSEALRGLTAFNLASVIMAIFTSMLIQRFGSSRLLIFCCVASLICLISIGTILANNSGAYSALEKWLVISMVGSYGAFSGAIFATLYSLLAYAYASECRSSGIGFGMMIGRMGGITTILTGGYLLDIMDSNPIPFLAALVIATIAALAGTQILDRHIPKIVEGNTSNTGTTPVAQTQSH